MDDGNDQSYGSSNQNLSSDQGPMSFYDSTELESHQESHKEDRPYKCNLCEKSYRHAGSLVNHKKTHQIGLYTCLICQKEYSNPMGLKSHLRTHSEEKRFKCEQCGEAFRMSQQLYNHRKSLHGYYSTSNGEKTTRSAKFDVQSPVLVESSNLMSNLENYIAESMLPVDFPQIVSKYYPDEKAEEEGPMKEDVEGHEAFTEEKDQTNDSNIEEYRYKCTQCGKAYKHAGSLANHRQSHMVGIYQCAVCYKEFSNLMAMKNHCRLHSDSRARHSCKSPRSSGKSTGVHRPDEQQYSEDRSDAPQIDCKTSMEKELYPPSLPELSKTIKSEEDDEAVLIPHTHQQDELASSISPPTKPNDNLTPNPFSSDTVVENIMEEEAKVKANDFLAEQPEYDDSHEDETKSGDRPYKCQECGKTYRHAGSLINHKKTHQTGVYSCSLCSKQMFNMAALKNHVRAHFKSKAGRRLGDTYFSSVGLSDELYQNQEDSYQCGVCDEVSFNESDFLQHQLLHQQQEIQEMSHDKLVEKVPEAGTWQEAPQGSSDDSAYSSGPGFPDIKIETDNLALQQWSQEDSLATAHKVKLENGDADIQNAETSFEQSFPEPIACQDPESTEMEEHQQATDDRPHKCDLCGRTYRHKSSLINHKLTHKTGVYQCSLCPKQYSNLMALRNHVRFHSRSYAGRRASRRSRQFFRTKPRFLQNRNSHSLADSAKLNIEMPHEITINNRDVGEPLHESQNCCPCGKSFDCSEHFQTHRRSCPSAITESPAKNPTNVLCEISTSPSSEKDLSKVNEPVEPQEKVVESSENHGRRVYECDLCSKSYRHSGSLINHKRTHQTGDYMCPYCSKHVLNMAALKNHIRIHHKAKKGQQGELRVDHALLYSDLSYPPAGKGQYSCVSCKEMFQTESDLVAHQMVHISLEGNRWDYEGPRTSSPEINKDTTFRGIGDCDWDHSNNQDYQDDHKHLNSEDEEKPSEYTCVECGEVYDHLDDLTDHKRSHQAGIYQCSFCPKEYPNLLALRSHFETHTKPQTLRNTSLERSDGNELVDNQLLVDNRYDCGHCGLIFSNEGDFHQHQVAHEKQVMDESLPGLHTEEQVPEFFSMHSSERELLSRIKSEIEETERSEANDGGSLLSHICGFCGKTYDDLESLQAHSFSHSNEEEAPANENLHHETALEEHPQQHSPILKEGEGSGSTCKSGESPESRPYTCKQCGKSYRHGGSLVNHKKTHLVGNFQCVACSRRYPNLAAYRTHLRHHPKCRQPAAFNNPHERLALQDSVFPSGDEKPLTFSQSSSDPAPDVSGGQPNDINKIQDFTSKEGRLTSQYYSQMMKNKNSRRRFSRQIGRIREVQKSKQTSLESSMSCALDISDVEDKKVQACEFCGKTFGVKELALHLSGHCGGHSAKVSGLLVEHKEEVQNIPILPDPTLLQNEGETGFYWRPFRCEVCGRTYRHAGSLINHKQTHKTGIFRCSICQKRFFNLMAMKNHNRIHFELKRHKCLDCGKAFRLRKQLDTHQRIHRQRTSARKLGRRNRRSRYRRFAQGRHQKSLMQVSSEGSSDNKTSDCRVKKEKDPDARPYQCEECGRSYRHAGSLFNHKKSHKTGQYHCSICDKTYSNLMALKNHQRTHYEAKRHSCSQCGKTFKWKRQLLRHQLVHLQEGSRVDSQVPFKMEKVKLIDGHQQENSTVVREESSTDKEDISSGANMIIHDSSESTSQPQPVCVTCGISFTNYEELANHACRRNSIDTLASEGTGTGEPTQSEHKDERPHRCDICNRTYRHASSLHTHKSTHKRGNYKCSICHKEFLNPISLKAHLRTHKAVKRFQCGDCGQTFRSSQQLVSHKTTVHTGEKPLLCTICNRGFSCQATLRHHLRTHKPLSSPSRSSSIVLPSQTPISGKITSRSSEKFHKDQTSQGDRKYKCKQCGRSYLHAASLFNHQKTHNIGVYKCPNCLKVYSNLLAFKNHLRIHRYSCKECGKAFRNSTDLATHSKVHEEGSFTCSLCDKHFLCRSSLKRHQQVHSNPAGDLLDPQPVSCNFMVEVT